MKGATFKDYWDLETGASYIPWDKITGEQDLEKLSDGAWIVPDSCPPGMKPPEMKRESQSSLAIIFLCFLTETVLSLTPPPLSLSLLPLSRYES